MPLKTVGQSSVMVADVGKAVDAQAIQTNIVRVDGQPSVYLPILKQGGDTNTIAVVNGIRGRLEAPGGHSEAVRHSRRVRPVRLRENGHQKLAQ